MPDSNNTSSTTQEVVVTPGENKFLTFGEFGSIPEFLMDEDTYAANLRRQSGFAIGEPADNALMNTALRQLSLSMKGLANVIAANGTSVSAIVTAEEIQAGIEAAIANMIDRRVLAAVTPLLAAMQAQIDSYAAAYHGVPAKGILPIACTQDELEQFLIDYPQYKVCDGKNGTVDLQDKFIICTGTKTKPHETGGSRTFSNLKIKDTELAIDQMPKHNHIAPGAGAAHAIEKWPYGAPASAKTYIGTEAEEGYRVFTSTSGKGKGHNHEVADATSSDESKASGMLPPYYALIFVQKIKPY